MELSFVKEGRRYFAEFKATSDFNLHIEKTGSGFLYVQQKTVENAEYDSIRGATFAQSDVVIDIDFTALVYPKWIKIVTEVEPTLAVVTYNA